MLAAAGLADGRFLVRERAGYPGQYVLSIVYRTRPTHHLISFDNGLVVVRRGPCACTITRFLRFEPLDLFFSLFA
jgi:hypothetical protein